MQSGGATRDLAAEQQLGISAFTVESAVRALHVLQRQPDKYFVADRWLQAFQKSAEAWNVSVELLKREEFFIQVFAAQTLKTKIVDDGRSLSGEKRMQLQNMLCNILGVAARNAQDKVLTLLCVALCDLLLQGLLQSANQTFFANLIQWGQQDNNAGPMLRIMRLMPEEVEEHKLIFRDEQQHVLDILQQHSGQLVQVLLVFLSPDNNYDTSLKLESLETVKTWLGHGLMDIQNDAPRLMPAIQQLLPSNVAALLKNNMQLFKLYVKKVIPIVIDIVSTVLLLPAGRKHPQLMNGVFTWIGSILGPWLNVMSGTKVMDNVEERNYGVGNRAHEHELRILLGKLAYGVQRHMDVIVAGKDTTNNVQPVEMLRSYAKIFDVLLYPLADSRLRVSLLITDCFFRFFNGVDSMSRRGNKSWVWSIDNGAWFINLLQSVYGAILRNCTFRYKTTDLSFLYTEAAPESLYREDFDKYRTEHACHLISVIHDLLSRVDDAKGERRRSFIDALINDINKVLNVLRNNNEDNLALRRLEAFLWCLVQCSDDPLLVEFCHEHLVRIMRYICRIPFNGLTTATSAKVVQYYNEALEYASDEDVALVVKWTMSECIDGGSKDPYFSKRKNRELLYRTFLELARSNSRKVVGTLRRVLPMVMQHLYPTVAPVPWDSANIPTVSHYGQKLDTSGERAVLPLRLRGKLARGLVQLAIERGSHRMISSGMKKKVGIGGSNTDDEESSTEEDFDDLSEDDDEDSGETGLERAERRRAERKAKQERERSGVVVNGDGLIRWTFFPICMRLREWIETSNRAYRNGVSGELYVLGQALQPLERYCALYDLGLIENRNLPIPVQQWPGVPPAKVPVLEEVCNIVMQLCQAIVKARMTSPNIIHHMCTLLTRITTMAIRDPTRLTPLAKKVMATVMQVGCHVFSQLSAGQSTVVHIFKRIMDALLGLRMRHVTDSSGNPMPAPKPWGNNEAEFRERMMFVNQLMSHMCQIGEQCVEQIPKHGIQNKNPRAADTAFNPAAPKTGNLPKVAMGSLLIDRFCGFFELMCYMQRHTPDIFYRGMAMHNGARPLFLQRVFFVYGAILMQAEKKTLLIELLRTLYSFATENRPQWKPAMAEQFSGTMSVILRRLIVIVLRALVSDLPDIDFEKDMNNIMERVARAMSAFAKYYREIFGPAISQALQAVMTNGGTRPLAHPQVLQQCVEKFAQAVTDRDFKDAILEFAAKCMRD